MKSLIYLFSLSIALVSMASCGSPEMEKNSTNPEESDQKGMIAKGEYLVKSIGCDHCHTPKMMTAQGPVTDSSKWMMGFESTAELPAIDKAQVIPGNWVLLTGDLNAAVGPWGISYAANLTPDPTGIGNWSYENFKIAVTEGKYKGQGRPLFPPMPIYKDLKDEDVKAIFEYLQSIEPIKNVVPDHIPFGDIEE